MNDLGPKLDAVGFIGVGTIAEAMVQGLRRRWPDLPIRLSPRSERVSVALAAADPLIERKVSNATVVDSSGIVVLSVLPFQLDAVVADLAFRPDQIVVSCVASTPLAEVQALVSPARACPRQGAVAAGVGVDLGPVEPDRAELQQAHLPRHLQHFDEQGLDPRQKAPPERRDRVVVGMLVRRHEAKRLVPLPMIAWHEGPIILYPPLPQVRRLFEDLGTLVAVEDETTFATYAGGSAAMSTILALQAAMAGSMVDRGATAESASLYVRSLFLALSQTATRTPTSAASTLVQRHETPGGLNERVRLGLEAVGWFAALGSALENLSRLVRTDLRRKGPP